MGYLILNESGIFYGSNMFFVVYGAEARRWNRCSNNSRRS